ncbi:MAG TPA: biopolymer transporter ExbD [Longimicrobiaceae bacterium]|nr:biopolymer transporter ExbD [Longimicrobiaceae bacterium]
MSKGHLGGAGAFGGSPMPQVAGFESDVNADINVTPMIDVMLVLLIIFMVVTPALSGYQAVLPKAKTSAPEKDKRVTLGIDKAGDFYIEGTAGQPTEKVTSAQLAAELAERFRARPEDHVLYMKADHEAGYDRVLTAIDAARNAGVRRIGAITEMPAARTKQ